MNKVLVLPSEWSDLVFDDKIYRKDSTKRNDLALWAVGKEFQSNGKTGRIASGGDWKNPGDAWSWRSWGKADDKELDEEAKAFIAKAREEQKLRRAKEIKDSMESSLVEWDASEPSKEIHGYLKSKGVPVAQCDRTSPRGELLTKYEDVDGNFRGIQKIYWGYEKQKYIKHFNKDSSYMGFFVIVKGDLKTAKKIYIGEGRATMGSVALAMDDGESCFIAVLAACNIVSASKNIREKFGNKVEYIFCSDVDHGLVGYSKCLEATKYGKGSVKIPIFPLEKPELKDFNDLHFLHKNGLELVKKSIEDTYIRSVYIFGGGHEFEGNIRHCITPLGVTPGDNGGKFHFLAANTPMKFSFSPGRLGRSELRSLAQGDDFWMGVASKMIKIEVNEEIIEVEVPDWNEIPNKLVSACYNVGLPDQKKIRGPGTWRDLGGYVTNLGDSLLYNGIIKSINHKSLQWRFHYVASEKLKTASGENKLQRVDTPPLTDEQLLEIEHFFKSSAIGDNLDVCILLGAMTLGQIPSLLRWKPGLWFMGEQGKGKTAILNAILVLIPICKMFEKSGEFFVRKSIDDGAYSVIIDEMDPGQNDPAAARKIAAVMNYVRSCVSPGQSLVGAGTKDQNVVLYKKDHMFFLGSIQATLLENADKTRIYVIPVSSEKASLSIEEFDKLTEQVFGKWVDEAWCIGFLKRTIARIPQIFENIKRVREILGHKGVSPRMCDQIGHFLGGYFAIKDLPVTEEAVEPFYKKIFVDDVGERLVTVTQAEKCLQTILELKITPTKSIEVLIKEMVDEDQRKLAGTFYRDENTKILATWGVAYDVRKKELFIQNNHSGLGVEMLKFNFIDYTALLNSIKGVKDCKGHKYLTGFDSNNKGAKRGFFFLYEPGMTPTPNVNKWKAGKLADTVSDTARILPMRKVDVEPEPDLTVDELPSPEAWADDPVWQFYEQAQEENIPPYFE